jgi:hypothetical protein
MRISIGKTKVLALRGKDPIRIKTVINERILDQVLNFNYLGYNMGLNREMDINVKLQRFQQIRGTIKRTLAGKLGKRHYSGFIRLWQYQLFCVTQNVEHSPKDKKVHWKQQKCASYDQWQDID